MTDAKVLLWGSEIGAVSWIDDREVGVFQYTPEFVKSGFQLAPIKMPLNEYPYEFPELSKETFRGLPGLLADSLPDKFGNAVIDAWLASTNQEKKSFNPVKRLCYIGKRGMGGLEYKPAFKKEMTKSEEIDIGKLVDFANIILTQREGLSGALNGVDDKEALSEILRVGTSAGGARAKAVIAWNPKTNKFRSGQVDAPLGFEQWILKFDGISNNRDRELADPKGYGRIEFAYYLLAIKAGIDMTECRLHHEGGRSHFMTKRFDRNIEGEKLHMQSLCAMAHFDYNEPSLYSYEQAIQVMKQLGLSIEDLEQEVLRAIFNVVGRNQDDHVKNIAFLMNRKGEWKLSPAFDMSYSFNPNSDWTNQHQMSINQKRTKFQKDDLISLAALAGLKQNKAIDLIKRVIDVFKNWTEVAQIAGVSNDWINQIKSNLCLSF